MTRAITVVLLTLFLAACYSPRSIQTTKNDPVWDYGNDPYACKAMKGTC